jgi:hypothetical protein
MQNLMRVALVALAAAACRPVTVSVDCPVSVEAGTEFDIEATVEKSGGEPEFDVNFAWSSPTPYRAELLFLAVDGEALDPPEDSGTLDVLGVGEGLVTVTAEGIACPDEEIPTCWGTLNVRGSATKSGLFGSDHDSEACEIDITTPTP